MSESTNIPAPTNLYKPSEIIGILRNHLATGQVNQKVVCLRGIYFKGNLTEQYGLEWGAKFEYNDQGQIVKEETMGDCDEYTATYAYDKDGNCVERSDGSKTITYEILETDSHNNWLKRTSSEGDTDERTITYFE